MCAREASPDRLPRAAPGPAEALRHRHHLQRRGRTSPSASSSVLWADEIVLVDSFSTDRTVPIARALPRDDPAARVLRLGGAEELGARPGAARLGADHRCRRARARGAGARDPGVLAGEPADRRLLHTAREHLHRQGHPPLGLVHGQGGAALPARQGALSEPARARRPRDRGPRAGAQELLPALHLPHLRPVLPASS